jgi:ATP-dependent DNA helicase RecQ
MAVYASLERLHADEAPVMLADVQADVAGVAKSKIRVILSLLKEWGAIRQHRRLGYSLLHHGVTREQLERLSSFYDGRSQRDRDKLDQMIVYAQTALCRWKKLVTYFDEAVAWDTCGACDNCLRAKAAEDDSALAPQSA